MSSFESQAHVDTQTAKEPSPTTPVHSSIQDISLSDASRPAPPSYVTATDTAAETAKVSPNSSSHATTPLPSISSVMNETSLQPINDKRPSNFTTASGESLQTQEAGTATQTVTQAPVNKSKPEETSFVSLFSLTQEASTGSQKLTSTRTTASSLKIVETLDAKVSSRTATSSPSLVYRSPQQAVTPAVRRNDTKPQVIYTHAHNVNHQPNESIYGTIMKRLLALEVNATLSTTYLEEQTRMVWETFRRIEDRLTSMEKAVSPTGKHDLTFI